MRRTRVAEALRSTGPREEILIKGWVRTRRDSKTFSFFEINDGSCLANIQVVADSAIEDYEQVKKANTGAAVAVTGELVESPGAGQKWEVRARRVELVGPSPDAFPLQKKRHSDEFLRSIAHLRPRTNKYGAVFRLRSALSFAIHRFFQERGFYYIHTPIITGADCEGAGELFRVTTLDLNSLPRSENRVDFSRDFFGRESNLTVSGQLSVEMFALSLGDVYTFGPTFRADNSNTRRHAAEFWMVEPEMAFCDLQGNMDLGEDLIRAMTSYALENCSEDLGLFARFLDTDLLETLERVATSQFERLSYREALSILSKSGERFDYEVTFGADLQSEHERFLTEKHFKKPVIVYDYPKSIKPFYMRVNDDGETVAAMDVLVPGVGEIIGGSQREERLEALEARLEELGQKKESYWWYLDSRRYGTAPHSGFGLGFERLMMFLTSISNIRDVIPFPRTPDSIEF
jgi:asparaginyl-tRNA synthetase